MSPVCKSITSAAQYIFDSITRVSQLFAEKFSLEDPDLNRKCRQATRHERVQSLPDRIGEMHRPDASLVY